MKQFFRWLFSVYSGEGKHALLFAGLGFLWSFGITLGQKFADVLFLLHVGPESLPSAYGITACVMMILTAFYLKAFHVIKMQRIFISVLIAAISFYTFAYFYLIQFENIETPQWIWFVLKIVGTVFFATTLTTFWSFIDQYYHLQDAKRLYSLFTSTLFLGVAATGLMMRSGILGFHQVTIMIVMLLISAIYAINQISQRVKPVYDETLTETETHSKTGSPFKTLFQAIIQSKFTLFLMAGNFLNYVLLVITEYSYLTAFDQRFDPGITLVAGGEQDAQLTHFLGQCIASVSIFNVLFGLFVYSRLVRQFGVSHLVLYTPIVLVLTFSGWLGVDALVFPLMGFFVVEGMLYVIDDNNFTLLLNAVPQRMKHKIRLIIESFSEPTGMLVSSILISTVPLNSKLLGLILSAFALGIALLLRKQYVKAIYINLAENAMHFQRYLNDWFTSWGKKQQQANERRLLAILQKGDEEAQLFAIEMLTGFKDPAVMPKLLARANSFSAPAKMRFLHIIGNSSFAKDPHVIEELLNWYKQIENGDLKNSLLFYLASQGELYPEEVVQELNSPNLIKRGAAIITLIRSWPDLPPKEANFNKLLAEQHLKELINSQNDAEVCMGVEIIGLDLLTQDLDTLLPFLKHENLKIARKAASSAAQIIDKHSLRYAPILISQLTANSDTEIRQSLLKALGKIGDASNIKEIINSCIHFKPNERRLTETIIGSMGAENASLLLAITKDLTMHDRCRMLAARILGRLDLPLLQQELYHIVTVEIRRAYSYYYHYQTIQSQYPHLDLTLLQDALLSNFYSVQDFIIQLLGIAGESEDCELLAHSLRSPNPKVRSHVIEALERTCDTKIYRTIYPLIADIPHSERIQAALRSIDKPLSLTELLDKMSLSPMPGDQMIATAFKYKLNLPGWKEALRLRLASQEEIFHHFAFELLES